MVVSVARAANEREVEQSPARLEPQQAAEPVTRRGIGEGRPPVDLAEKLEGDRISPQRLHVIHHDVKLVTGGSDELGGSVQQPIGPWSGWIGDGRTGPDTLGAAPNGRVGDAEAEEEFVAHGVARIRLL